MNNCSFVGNLTEDVKTTTVQVKDGTSITKGTMKLAVNNFGCEPAFIEFTLWEKTAENCAKYLKKGNAAAVVAHVENNNYEKNGVKIYGYQFVADSVQFISVPRVEKEN